ncbi:MAG: crossover junction endodeoxyribonuclease RuvC [Gammaproteobacteria bacterium]|nr:crossover junction endodeoxyribonuclease RuvC [Gammaproteobacteria bacterium]
MTIILGVDPGSRATGFGVIETSGKNYQYLTSGVISISGQFPARLQTIFNDLSAIIQQYRPDQAAIEEVFMHVNPSSALKLGQARGAAIVAIANNHIPLAEYAPRQIKQMIVGYGAATKDQVQHMVKKLLGIEGDLKADAADALAIALCRAHTRMSQVKT